MTHISHVALLVALAVLGACDRPTPTRSAQTADSAQPDTARQVPPPVAQRPDTGTPTAAVPIATPPPRTPTQARPPVDTSRPRPATLPTATDTPPVTAPLHDPYHQAPRDTVDARTYQGWKYYSLNCARCHGEDVAGTTLAPHLILSLKPDGPIPDAASFLTTVCSGRPEKGMPAWCALGLMPGQIDTIYAYVKGRSDGTLHPGRPARRE